MADAAHVGLKIAFVGDKREDSDDPANPNKQAGNSPPETRARKVLAKGRRRRSVNKDGSNKEEPGNAGGGNLADFRMEEGGWPAEATTTKDAATSPG
jgi:hypothetical protein